MENELNVNDLVIDIAGPIFEGMSRMASVLGSITLSTIVDGSKAGTIQFGSEVIVYAELELNSAFEEEVRHFSIHFDIVKAMKI